MNILLEITFNGAAYHGFQVQQNAVTICEVLQNAMQKLFGYRPNVKGCSRTDAGVHALSYCVSFKYETAITMYKMPLAINNFLPIDIRVKSAKYVPNSFHARYSATGKQYRYVFLNSAIDDPLAPGLYHKVPMPLNVEKMDEAAKFLIGKHDFASFMSAGSSIEDTVRTITHLQVYRQQQRVILEIAADGFLYNMVRIIAGTLLKVGMGKHTPKQVEEILQAKNRACAGITMPAQGLFLEKVFYPQQAFIIEE